jgi:hypothetical protein
MRASTAYFVGAGTIVAALAIGLGGGIIAGNIMNPVTPRQAVDSGQHDRRAATAAAAGAGTLPSGRVDYLTGSQVFGAWVAAPAVAEEEAEVKPAAPAIQANTETAAPVPPPSAVQPADQASAAPDNAFAKARDADVKRSASERRRSDRRERWADRHRHAPRATPTDWDDVARNVRADSEDRDVPRLPRGGGPQIMLFGDD